MKALTSDLFFEKIFTVKKEGITMYQERIMLSPKEILEKEFKLDTRGYRPQEVDKFLDTIISDYEEMFSIIITIIWMFLRLLIIIY